MRDYQTITDLLGRIECNFPVDELSYRGFRIWPILRNKIANDYFWDIKGNINQALTAYAQIIKMQSMHVRNVPISIFHNLLIRILDFRCKFEVKKIRSSVRSYQDVLFLTIGFEYTKLNGKYYNKFIDPIKELLDSLQYSYTDLETGFQSGHFHPKFFDTIPVWDALRYIYLKERFISREKYPQPIVRFDEFLAFSREHGYSFDLDPIDLSRRFDLMLSRSAFFEELLISIRPKICFVVCYYHDIAMALISACNRLGIKTIEVQHSIINKDDWNWTRWSNIPKEGYDLLPNYFWCWSEQYAELMACWSRNERSNLKPMIGGNLWFAKWLEPNSPFHSDLTGSLKGPERTILCTIPFGNASMMKEIIPDILIEAMTKAPKTWKWLIRLHYKSDKATVNHVVNYLGSLSANIDIHHASEYQLYDVFRLCDYHISQTCSTVLEAEIFNLPNIIVGELGRSWFNKEIDSGIYLYAVDCSSLISFIENCSLPCRRTSSSVIIDKNVASTLLTNLIGAE